MSSIGRRLMDVEYARGIALGEIDPLTKLAIVDLNPDSSSNLFVNSFPFLRRSLLIGIIARTSRHPTTPNQQRRKSCRPQKALRVSSATSAKLPSLPLPLLDPPLPSPSSLPSRRRKSFRSSKRSKVNSSEGRLRWSRMRKGRERRSTCLRRNV